MQRNAFADPCSWGSEALSTLYQAKIRTRCRTVPLDVEFIDCGDGVESFNVTRQLPGSDGFSISMRADYSELGEGWGGLAAAADTAGTLVWYHNQIADEVNRRFPDVRCDHVEKMVLRNGRTVCLECGSLL